MADDFDPVAHNRAAWDREVKNDNEWTRPTGPEVIARAQAGDWSVVLAGYQPVPRSWFPASLADVPVLCLASGGGQQGPVLAAAGAAVTVFDNSPRQLGRDQEVAAGRRWPSARCSATCVTWVSFPMPASMSSSIRSRMCSAPILRRSGASRSACCAQAGPCWLRFMNPDVFIFDIAALERDELVVRYPLPFSSLGLPDAERLEHYGDGQVEYSHSLTEQIGGQMDAGFTLTHLVDAPHHADATARYMPGFFATRAIRPG